MYDSRIKEDIKNILLKKSYLGHGGAMIGGNSKLHKCIECRKDYVEQLQNKYYDMDGLKNKYENRYMNDDKMKELQEDKEDEIEDVYEDIQKYDDKIYELNNDSSYTSEEEYEEYEEEEEEEDEEDYEDNYY